MASEGYYNNAQDQYGNGQDQQFTSYPTNNQEWTSATPGPDHAPYQPSYDNYQQQQYNYPPATNYQPGYQSQPEHGRSYESFPNYNGPPTNEYQQPYQSPAPGYGQPQDNLKNYATSPAAQEPYKYPLAQPSPQTDYPVYPPA